MQSAQISKKVIDSSLAKNAGLASTYSERSKDPGRPTKIGIG
jgi:hypothetical protein